MKNEKGITLITLAVTLIVLIILTFTISINAPDLISMKRKNNFENDSNALKEEIDQYYARYNSLPIINPYTNVAMLENSKNINDNNHYYVIDLSKINVSLKYGKDYEKVAKKEVTEEITDMVDIYIINEQSHTIYYPKGVEYNKTIHYTVDLNYKEISAYVKIDLEIERMDNQNVKLVAKAVDIGGIEIECYQFYFNKDKVGYEVKTNIETSSTTASYDFHTLFGDYEVYVEVIDKQGNSYRSKAKTFSDDTIEVPEELVIFRDNVNLKKNTYEGRTIYLANNIDLSSVCSEKLGTWKPIGYPNINNMTFNGTFEGNNCTIQNLYIKEDNTFTALFGCIGNNSTIQNLSVTGSVTGRRSTAGIVGMSNGGNVIRCNNYCTVNTAEYGSKYPTTVNDRLYGYVAGVVANNHGLVEKCVNYGQITGLTCVGGIVGCNNGEKGIVRECFNIAQIQSTEATLEVAGIGGIVGNNQAAIYDVYNKGEILSVGKQAGGIIGWNGQTSTNITAIAKNIYNVANVTTGAKNNYQTGGCVGCSDTGNMENAYMVGNVTNKNTGVSATSLVGKSGVTIGTILGQGKTGTEQDLSGNYLYTTQAVMSGWTEEQIHTYLGSNFTKDTNHINDGYPILKWQK